MNNMTLLLIITIALSFIAKISGLIREVVLGYFYGTSIELDTFYLVYSLPELFITGISAALSIVLIPYLSKDEKIFTNKNNRFISMVFIYIILFGLFLTLLFIGFKKPLLNNFIYYSTDMSMRKIDFIYFIAVAQIVPFFISAILLGIVTKMEEYKRITLISIPVNLIVIMSVFFMNDSIGVVSLGMGILIGVIFQSVYLYRVIKKADFRFHLFNNFNKRELIQFSLSILPIYFGTIIQRLNIFIDRYIASNLGAGSVSSLAYADRVIQMVVMVIISVVSMIVFNKISSNIKNEQNVVDIINESINFNLLLLLPVTVFLLIFSEEIILVLFKRGEFTLEATKLTSLALFGYSIGLVGIGIRYLLNRIYYSYNDYRTPTINTVISAIINVFLSIFLSRIWGVFGLAFATSLTMIVSSIMLGYKLKVRYTFIANIKFKDFFKSVYLAIFISIGLYISKIFLDNLLNSVYLLIINAFIAIIIFILLGYLMKIQEITILVKKVISKMYIFRKFFM